MAIIMKILVFLIFLTNIDNIVSTQIIKPSLPTPNTLRYHKLSFLDQLEPSIYIPYIFFYQNHESKLNHHVQISNHLKQSLSRILTVFYPLAGTVYENSFIDCDDSGVEFTEARVRTQLARVIESPNMEELKQLVPFESSFQSSVVFSVKFNVFDCGGIAVGVSMRHKAGNTLPFVTFMNAWAANSRTKNNTKIVDSTEYQPDFDYLTLHFPPYEALNNASSVPSDAKITTRRLVFDAKKLEKLKTQRSADSGESLSAFIWHNFIESNKLISTKEKTTFAALYGVNVKPRTIPRIPDRAFGNCETFAIAVTSETTNSIEDLRSKISLAVSEIDDSYIKNVITDHVEYLKVLAKIAEFYNSGTDVFSFSDMSKAPIYDTDFGWGKPDWVCATTIPSMNLAYMLSTPSGDGIEAWINLPDDLFQLLEIAYNKL